MIPVHCFQFLNIKWTNFSEWGLLMDQSYLQQEVQRIFPQFSQTVCSTILLSDIIEVDVCSFILFFCREIKILLIGFL